MDGLLAEINKKKTQDFGSSSSGSKYLKRGDLERQKEEEAARQREAERKRKAEDDSGHEERRATKMRKEAEAAKKASLSSLRESETATPDSGSPAPPGEEKERFNLSPEECVRRLRAKGQPIRLFGETDKDRRLRLRAVELLEERGVKGQDDFKRAIADHDLREEERRAQALINPKAGGKDDEKMQKYTSQLMDLDLIKTDFNKLHPLIYWHFKSILKEWGDSLDARPDDVKRSTQGKLAAATQVQSAQNLKPLFKGLRTRDLGEDVVGLLAEVVYYMQQRNYQKANDAYLRLSIGNAAWPLGVTSVGMHARSNDNRTVNNVAHVLNDEVSRKYIQAVKRLMTYAQNVRPAESKALMMG